MSRIFNGIVGFQRATIKTSEVIFLIFYVVRIRTYLAEDNPGYACRIVPMACCLNSSARATHVINEVAFMMKMNALSISRKNRKR